MLLEVRQTLDISAMEKAIQHLLVHHDMLRARFKREARRLAAGYYTS